MHHEIDLAPSLPQHLEHRVDGYGVGDVAMTEQQGVEFPGQRLDPLLQRVALPGERDLRAGIVACLGDAPGDRAVVGDAQDHAALALHQSCFSRHRLSNPASGLDRGTPALHCGTVQIGQRLTLIWAAPLAGGIVPSFGCYVG